MRIVSLLLGLSLTGPLRVCAQVLPRYVPINPVLTSRSPLYAQPLVLPGEGWRKEISLDYANAIETGTAIDGRGYMLDAELSRLDIWLGRDFGVEWFGFVDIPVREAHDGFLDSFLNGYHDLIGLPVPARNRRPKDSYGWTWELPDRSLDVARPHGPFLGDIRIGTGRRIGTAQAIVIATLPTTSTSIAGWSRGTAALALQLGIPLATTPRFTAEASVMTGIAPTHGDLAEYQRTAFVGASGSLWWRAIGQQALYATFFMQSSNWKGTGFSALESAEFTLDAGGLLRFGSGWPAIQLGITEDLIPRGPAVDVAARLGVLW